MNILFTSSGRRGYMIRFTKEIIGMNGKVFAGNSVNKVSSFLYADESVVTPLIYDINYIPFLLDYCIKNNITYIIPLFDIDLEKLSSNKSEFHRNGIQVVVSDYDVVKICNNKWKTYEFLRVHDILCPRTLHSLDDALRELSEGQIRFPVVIKPVLGMGSIGVYLANNMDELLVFSNRVKSEIRNSYLRYFEDSDVIEPVLYQEFISGQEYGLDVMNGIKGEYLITVPKRKLQMRAGETDSVEIVNDREMQFLGNKLSCSMKHIGNLDVDVIKSEDKIYVIEMNCRFGGGYPFSHIAGANLLKYLLTDKPDLSCLSSIRFGIELYKDINIAIKN